MAKRVILTENDIELVLNRLVAQIAERHPELDELIFVGIQRRGADLARRLATRMRQSAGFEVECGTLDINLYRDDWTLLTNGAPHISVSSMPFSIDGKQVILMDDVLFSGRTIRSALSALLDYGRPGKVELLVLIDRGHRELPICPDYVGRALNTEKDERVNVLLKERDGQEMVVIEK